MAQASWTENLLNRDQTNPTTEGGTKRQNKQRKKVERLRRICQMYEEFAGPAGKMEYLQLVSSATNDD